MNEMATKKIIAEVFSEVSQGIKSGSFEKKVRIGLTTFGSEHGVEEMINAAIMAKNKYNDFDIVLIGPKVTEDFEVIEVSDANTGHEKMVELLEKGLIDALAPRSGVYFNLEKNKYAREQNLRLAITKKYPVSRIIGPHVLVNYGWTTQIQQYMTLALNLPPIKGSTSSTNGYLSVPEVEFQYRSKKWWQAAIVDEAKRNKKNIYIQGFESVSPGFALVDMWMNKDLS